MKIIRGLHNVHHYFKNCILTIGSFDGFHLGHQQLIHAVEHHAKLQQLPAVLMTFEPQPNEFFNSLKPIPRLMRFREKCEWLMTATHIDYLLCVRFNQAFANISAADFITELLVKQLGVKALVIGDDFHFGANRLGNAELLQEHAQQYDFSVIKQPSFSLNDKRISSTQIRHALREGDFTHVTELLGRPYFLSGKVCYGNQLGRQLGFPTANVYLHRHEVALTGIFIVRVLGIKATPINGVGYVGMRPAIQGTRVLLEVHLFDFHADIYGKSIDVEFIDKIRDDQSFDTLEAMAIQIKKDIAVAKDFFKLYENH